MNPSRRSLLAGFVALPVATRLAPVAPAAGYRELLAAHEAAASLAAEQFRRAVERAMRETSWAWEDRLIDDMHVGI
jgi:hypothetical protein